MFNKSFEIYKILNVKKTKRERSVAFSLVNSDSLHIQAYIAFIELERCNFQLDYRNLDAYVGLYLKLPKKSFVLLGERQYIRVTNCSSIDLLEKRDNKYIKLKLFYSDNTI